MIKYVLCAIRRMFNACMCPFDTFYFRMIKICILIVSTYSFIVLGGTLIRDQKIKKSCFFFNFKPSQVGPIGLT